MITLNELLGNIPVSDVPLTYQHYLEDLHKKINLVRQKWGKPMIVSSGFRSKQDHQRIYDTLNLKREKAGLDPLPMPWRSFHLIGAAVDISDPDGSLYDWCVENEEWLREIGLWIEMKDDQKRVHFQSLPFGSYKPEGTIFFKPY